ncbi:non-heme ferritin-like protein [Klebsiella pneumoniae]|uniref:non-heme ferritin-like protein n=1 Tax=Klebsiella pneumoniae TaxID=573 RepID=UPI001E2BDFC2|nr:non-heme ferritin-like protein [Klebsiella pneumoniae]MCD5718873.1 non-heme ferritin-like protein [Klebsiella pneumoniae]MCP5599414.1 non-heme ferritin-like protein [Klebsiella pneumoniae]
MAVPGMAQKLNTQMNLEFHASNVYLNLSEWCARHRFDGAATFLRTRAQSSITLTMRVFDYLKKAGSWPIVNPDHACNPECTSLEDLFTQTLSDYQQRSRLLSGLAQEAKAQSDDSTWRFLTLLAEEQQQDGLLLQSVLEEIRNADKAGLGMEQTDRRLMAIAGEAQKAH